MAAFDGVEEFAITATGTLGVTKQVSNAFTGYASIQIVGSITATVQCQASFDNGTTWVAVQVLDMNAGTSGTSITAAGVYRADVGGLPRYRWQCTAFTAGGTAYMFRAIG